MELEVIKFIQGFSSPFLDFIFQIITVCGEGVVIIGVLSTIYWAINKEFGEYIGFSYFTSMLINNFVKDIFKASRPIGQVGVVSLRTETATGYSFPSGHSQGASTFYTALSIGIKKRWVYIVFGVLIFFIGLSRLYLGVHYPRDVIAGIFLGILSSIACYKLFNIVSNRLVLYVIVFILFLPVLFINNSPDFIKAFGGFFGFVIGIWFEGRYVGFTTRGTKLKKVLRVSLGIVLIGIVYGGLKLCLPESNVFYFIRYAITCFIGLGLYPMIFTKLKL
ncbi:MAG: phosphatase PAP2 family protein [Clostridium sp.]